MIEARVERVLPFAAQALYDLLADVESYPRFMPGWDAARVLHRDGDVAQVRQTVRLLDRTWDFDSQARFDAPHGLSIRAGAPLRDFDLRWELQALSASFTRVRAALRAEFDDPLLDALVRRALPTLLRRTVDAIELRAAHCAMRGAASPGEVQTPAASR